MLSASVVDGINKSLTNVNTEGIELELEARFKSLEIVGKYRPQGRGGTEPRRDIITEVQYTNLKTSLSAIPVTRQVITDYIQSSSDRTNTVKRIIETARKQENR